MTTKIKRSQFKTFLNTTPAASPGSETYFLVADGVVDASIDYGPKTTEETYIDEDSATISLDSYAPKMAITATAKKGDPVFEFIDNLRVNRSILGDAETTVVNVWLYETPAGTAYPAEQQAASIQIDKFGGKGGDATQIDYTINYLGDAVDGDFDTADSSFTATGA
jgi:hypothetical protein